jgi:hypothetical protein
MERSKHIKYEYERNDLRHYEHTCMIRKIYRFFKVWKCVANKKQSVMCDVGGGASVGRIPGRIPGTRAWVMAFEEKAWLQQRVKI